MPTSYLNQLTRLLHSSLRIGPPQSYSHYEGIFRLFSWYAKVKLWKYFAFKKITKKCSKNVFVRTFVLMPKFKLILDKNTKSPFISSCWRSACSQVFLTDFNKTLNRNIINNSFKYLFCSLQILNSHYEKKIIAGKNLLIVSKCLLVTIVRTWGLMRFSVSEKIFNASKFWLILSKNFFDLGIEFIYEKMTT